MFLRFLFLFLSGLAAFSGLQGATPEAILRPLIDPGKLDTLQGDRAANARLRKIVYWLETARSEGRNLEELLDQIQNTLGYIGTARALEDHSALLRNRMILERLGCLNAEGMLRLRSGKTPTITRGPYAGDVVHVDHIIPRAVAPSLDEKLYNLEFMPSKLNLGKGAKIGERQVQLARRWRTAGLIPEEDYRAVCGDD